MKSKIETFPPTKDFEEYLKEYVNNKCDSYPQAPVLPSLKEGISDPEERIKLMVFFCNRRLNQRLDKTTNSPRLISKEEINHLRVCISLPFSILSLIISYLRWHPFLHG